MISRKRILSNSCQHLSMHGSLGYLSGSCGQGPEEYEDVWFEKDKLYQDHIQEILNKYQQLDDEIWGKIICMERNRRVAKAYARAPVITVTGAADCFDGCSIGLAGFENPHRDKKVELVTAQIGDGIKITYDQTGNVLVRCLAKRSFYVKEWHQGLLEPQSSCVEDDLIKSRGRIVPGKSYKIFEMRKFLTNVSCEMLNSYPDRKKLECQCISVIGFAKESSELLQLPVWMMVINIVALEMLKSEAALGSLLKRPHMSLLSLFEPVTSINTTTTTGSRQRRRDLHKDDPYSLTNSSSSTSGCGMESTKSSNLLFTKTSTLSSTVRRRQRKEPKVLRKELPKPLPLPLLDRSLSLGSTLKLAPFSSPMILEELIPLPDYDTEVEDPYYSGLVARVSSFKEMTADKKLKQKSQGATGGHGPSSGSNNASSNSNNNSCPAASGCLNSVLRHLPLQAVTRTSSNNIQSNNSSSSGAQDSDDQIYAHIYSSIGDSKGTAAAKGKAKRSASIPKTWRFFMKK